jgi:gliding motility-associated-like protein
MKSLTAKVLLLIGCINSLHQFSFAQSSIPTFQVGGCTPFNRTIYNLPCGQTCVDIKLQTPHIKQTSDYEITSVCYSAYQYSTPAGNELTGIYVDDNYSPIQFIPFGFCFYDSIFTKCVIGSNGLLTFDVANAAPCGNSWQQTFPIPYAGGTICSNGAAYYPKSSIMGVFSDLFPVAAASPPDRKIEWHIEGTAPGRKFVVSYYHVGMYGDGNYSTGGTNCNSVNPTTFQIVLYESTGLIDVYILNKTCVATSNANAILGVQDWTRTKAVSAPGKNATPWTSVNEGYRFTPKAGGSRFLNSELLTLGGTHVAWGDTATTLAGILDIQFPNVCVAASQTKYLVKTSFSSCSDPSENVFTQDTVTINETVDLFATATSTATTCGPPSGTITVTVPAAAGTAPFTYTLDNPPGVNSNSHTYTFNNVSPGPHTAYVSDANGCGSSIPITVALNNTLTVSATSNPTSCNGVNNGVITVTPPNTTPPYQYSLNGGPYQPGNTFSNLAAGNYTISVQDGGGCSGTTTVNVGVGSAITGTASTTATSCPGVSNGTITVTATSGTAPYQYSIDGSAYQTSNVFTGVSATTHYIVIKDAFGCISNSIAAVVASGPGLTGTAASTATSCNGVNNGTITVTPTSGTAPYQYYLDAAPPQGSNVFINVSAGPHTVVFKDVIGCSSNPIPVTVAAGAGPTGTATSTATSCPGVNNGTITATGSNGTAPYQYSLDGSAYQTGNTFTNVSSGPHNIVAKDAVGCTSANIPVIVAAGTGPSGTATSTSTSCIGVNNGTITATGNNGVTPYQYSLDGLPYQTGNIFTNIAAGPHNVVVKDALGCLSSAIAVTVATGSGVTANTATTATACNGVNNGTITVTPTNGSSPYQYSLDGAAYQLSNVFINVAAGPHTVVILDASGCLSPNIPVTVAAGAGPSGTAAATPTSCSGATNGIITVTATNGTSPYQYALDGGSYQASNVFNNVVAGLHNVVVKDAAGCLSPAINTTVAAGAALNVTVASTGTSCNGASNGTITLTPTNGSSPYQYSLNPGPTQTSNVFNNLAPGNYTITVIDANGCTANNLPAVIAAGVSLTATINQTNVSCNGLSNGSFTVNVQAPGTAPFQYSLDNIFFQAANNFNGLAAGNYTVYFKDNINCTGTQAVTITQPAALAMNVATQPVLCNGQSNGVINITSSGGVTPYQYSLNGTTYQTGSTFNIAAGAYTVYVKDNNGCIKTQPNVTITQPAPLTLSATTSAASCNGGADGVITATAGGGNSGFQYSIDGVNFQPSNTFNVTAGNYTVTVKDGNSCSSTTNTTVILTNNLTFSKGNDTTICEGGSAQLSAISNAASFIWTPATALSSTSIANPVANPTTTTQYTVMATLGGCSTNGIITVTVNAAPIPNAGADADICLGQDAQLNATGGTVYQWTPATYLSSATSSNPIVIKPQQTTQYSLQVVDSNGCTSLISDIVLVKITPSINVTVNPKDSVVAEGDMIQLNATSIGTNYNWTNPVTLSNQNIPNPVATMPAGSIGNIYTYVVTASTSAGCIGTATVTLRVYKGPDIYIPTAFTPNGDGKNDKFFPFPVGIKTLNYFRVYNRWGRLLFTTTTLYDGWDGLYKGMNQPPDVYVWVAQAVAGNGKVISKKGTVTLIR